MRVCVTLSTQEDTKLEEGLSLLLVLYSLNLHGLPKFLQTYSFTVSCYLEMSYFNLP